MGVKNPGYVVYEWPLYKLPWFPSFMSLMWTRVLGRVWTSSPVIESGKIYKVAWMKRNVAIINNVLWKQTIEKWKKEKNCYL